MTHNTPNNVHIKDSERPNECPNCGLSLFYVGHAPNYSVSHTAEIYTCTYCDTWVDWVQPRSDFATSNCDNDDGNQAAQV